MRSGSCSAPVTAGGEPAISAAIVPQRQPAGRPAAADGKRRHAWGTRQLEGRKRFALRRRSRFKPLDQRVVCDQDYHEHTLGERSDSRSVAYIRCLFRDGTSRWGVGIDSDVARASIQAFLTRSVVPEVIAG